MKKLIGKLLGLFRRHFDLGFRHGGQNKLAPTTHEPSLVTIDVKYVGGPVSVPATIGESPRPKKSSVSLLQRPEIALGTRVIVFSPPQAKTFEAMVCAGVVVSRGRRGKRQRARIVLDNSEKTRRSVKNLMLA